MVILVILVAALITHATPGAMYAHSEDRDWEADTSSPAGCGDIARQLIQVMMMMMMMIMIMIYAVPHPVTSLREDKLRPRRRQD